MAVGLTTSRGSNYHTSVPSRILGSFIIIALAILAVPTFLEIGAIEKTFYEKVDYMHNG